MRNLIAFITFLVTSSFILESKDGLVSHWSFDELNSSQFKDHSVNSNHGTVYGAKLTEGIRGNALYFDGIDDFASIPGEGNMPPIELEGLEYGSISLWFKVEEVPLDHGIAPIFYYGTEEICDFFDAANKGLIIEVGHSPIHYQSEKLYFTIWKDGCTYPSFCFDTRFPVSKNEWHHFVAVVGPDYNTGYLDGEEMTNRRYNFGSPKHSQFFADAVEHEKLWLGKGHWDRTIQHFKGAIDEVRIYNRPLSSDEVSDLFNEQFATSIYDKSINTGTVKIYPNPSNGKLSIALSGIEDPVESIQIYNYAGIEVLEIKPNLQYEFSLNQLNMGIYFIEVNFGTSTIREKILIQN